MKKLPIVFLLIALCLFSFLTASERGRGYPPNITYTDNIRYRTEFKIGDETNYAEFAADGELTLHGTARVKKYIQISAGRLVPGASPPGADHIGTYSVLDFSTSQTESSNYTLHVPANWALGTDIEIAIYWCPTTDAAGGKVSWEVDWEARQIDDDTPGSGEVLGAGSTNIPLHDVTYANAANLQETSYGIIAGASLSIDDTIGLSISRDHDDDDDYAADAALVYIEVVFIIGKLGEAL